MISFFHGKILSVIHHSPGFCTVLHKTLTFILFSQQGGGVTGAGLPCCCATLSIHLTDSVIR